MIFLPQHFTLSLSGEYLLINGCIYLFPKVVGWWWRKEANVLAYGSQCTDIQALVDVLFLISQSILKLKESDITYTFSSRSPPKFLDFIMLAPTNASSSLWERRKASSDSLLMLDLGDKAIHIIAPVGGKRESNIQRHQAGASIPVSFGDFYDDCCFGGGCYFHELWHSTLKRTWGESKML